MINPTVREQAARYRKEFDTALPFRHLVMDYFFEPDKAEKLLADFPPFHPDNARNEFGGVGRKAVIPDIARISPFYAGVYLYIASPDFLDFVSQITGIPDLVHDEKMFGGGTHENLEGQELDTHVDFNFIEDRRLHRRLNLLLYLNTEWDVEWGGCIELHSNPRRPREDQIKVVPPLFNRSVLFETSERSWHGFEQIRLPEGKKHLSRKMLSIYLYTRERPADEIAPPHGTFYVQRPMPKRLVPGDTLTDEDVQELERLFARRDHWVEFYQKKELTDSQRFQQYIAHMARDAEQIGELKARMEQLKARMEELEAELQRLGWAHRLLPKKKQERPAASVSAEFALSQPAAPSQPPANADSGTNGKGSVQLPLAGYAIPERLQGLSDDGWMSRPFEAAIRLREPIEGVELRGYLPPQCHNALELQVALNGNSASSHSLRPGEFSVRVPFRLSSGELLQLAVSSDRTHCPARSGESDDARELMALLREIYLVHAAPGEAANA